MQSHTAESIKSLEGFDRAWLDEAQAISANSWRILRPTLRKPGSEIWAGWNPYLPEDPVDAFFRGSGSDRQDLIAVHANWSENPWFDDGTMSAEREQDRRARPDEYDHVWEGAYLTVSDAIIFRGRVFTEEFEAPDDAIFYYGADWGFTDPTALVRCFILNDCLYIDYESGGSGINLNEIPDEMNKIPGGLKWPWKGDSSLPQVISYLANVQHINITPAAKWQNSVEDGIHRLKAFRKIVVHPRCVNIAQEFRRYSYKVDPQSERVLPIIVDAWNHWIDALRYALDGVIQNRRRFPSFAKYAPVSQGQNPYVF